MSARRPWRSRRTAPGVKRCGALGLRRVLIALLTRASTAISGGDSRQRGGRRPVTSSKIAISSSTVVWPLLKM